ncbi:MAG: preprotein translocase subunit SecG [Longimicrobiales bacterium]
MFGLLLTLLILDGILLMVIVLLQAGKGGGLAAMGGGSAGTESFMGGRQAATVLTKSTWVTGAIFLALAVVLSILSTRRQETTPLLQDEFQSTPTAPQPILPGAGEDASGEGEGGGIPGIGEEPSGDQEGGGSNGSGQ